MSPGISKDAILGRFRRPNYDHALNVSDLDKLASISASHDGRESDTSSDVMKWVSENVTNVEDLMIFLEEHQTQFKEFRSRKSRVMKVVHPVFKFLDRLLGVAGDAANAVRRSL